MSRSRRKSPCIGITTARSDKPFKMAEHQRERSTVRQALHGTADDAAVPHAKRYGDPWRGCKDGKRWLPPSPARARWLRK